VDEIKSVGSRSSETENLVPFIVLKHKMDVQFGRVTFKIILVEGGLQQFVVFVFILEVLQGKLTSGRRNECFARLHLRSDGPHSAMAA
jgi:hypothetical protein